MAKKIDVHPAAAIFPMLSDSELAEMVKSIEAWGLREKIGVIQSDDPNVMLILDGRNRYTALKNMKVTDDMILTEFCVTIDLSKLGGATPEEYVLMANIERRNLGRDQRRSLAGKLAIMLAERQKNLPKSEQTDTLAEAAQKAGVSRRTAATAKQEALDMAASHSENETNPPTKKRAGKKKSGPKRPPANIIVVLGEMAADVNSFGHNFKIDELRGIVSKATDLINFAESKFQSVAKKAAEEAQKAADEANAALEAAKEKHSS